ncbi:MAG: hypothetical protein M1818_003866 [Claussenomyces sp. TS43310]|nr:MAG: hypothetical protein M1818_003866 [Claussenomyces sp. TS43310]
MASNSDSLAGSISKRVTGAVNSAKNSAGVHTVPAQINGRDTHFAQSFEVISPSTNKLLHHSTAVSVADAISAVGAAQAAFPAWRNTTATARRDLFLKVAEVFERRSGEFARIMREETGAPDIFATGFNIPLSRDILKDVAGRISSIEGSVPSLDEAGSSGHVYKEPYGVILAIAPWNAPYILGFRSVAYAIAAGNTAVLKASEFTPRCSWAIGDCFREAGLPPGVLNVIAHRSSDAPVVTKALIEDPRVKKINFTGSTTTGRILAELAGKALKPILLELGGKAPAIIWEDADVDLAAAECAMGAFLNSGQICMSTERIIVHKNIAQEFELKFKAAINEKWSNGGVVINRQAAEKNKQLLEDAVTKGASLLHGEIETEEDSQTRMMPIVVKDVKPHMDLYHTESFGPSVSLIVIETEDEALRVANDTEYGLTAAVFTEDLRRGLRFAKGIEAGAVHINAMSVHDETNLPHGGMKNSGYGRFGSVGLDEWVRTKAVTWKD